MSDRFDPLLRRHGLRCTQPRRLVLTALQALSQPVSAPEVHQWLTDHGQTTDQVTVYRTLDRFRALGVVHRHPTTGGVVLCSQPETSGHHGLLSCERCGRVEEFAEPELCRLEDRIAHRAGFHPSRHVSEIIGVCPSCT